jgi:hypothetical protein
MNKLINNLDNLTNFALDSFGIKDPLEVAYCPTCERKFTKPEEVEFVKSIGECGGCDHVRGDVNADMMADVNADMMADIKAEYDAIYGEDNYDN